MVRGRDQGSLWDTQTSASACDQCAHALSERFALASDRDREVRASAGTRSGGGLHESNLVGLVAHVAETTDRFRIGELDAFDVDRVLFQYSRAARELWKFCDMSGRAGAVARGRRW